VHDEALSALISVYGSGRLDEAAALCREILASEPDQPAAYLLLGKIHLDRSDAVQAVPLLRRAVDLAPDWPEIHANLGAALFLRGRLDEAAYHVRQACALDPDDAEAQNNLGVVLQSGGRADEAEAAFLRAIELRPAYFEALVNLGRTLHALGRYPEAVERLRLALALDPDNPGVSLALGEACMATGDLDSAERAFAGALACDPSLERAAACLASVRVARVRSGSVRKCVRDGVECARHGRMEAAEAALRQALRLAPEDMEALRALAAVLLQTRRPGLARPILEQLLTRASGDAGLLNNYGVALAALGDAQGAVDRFRMALEIAPEHREAHNNLAHALLDQNRLEEAIRLCRSALERWPDSPEFHDALGVGLSRRDDIAGALAAFRTALRLAPRFAPAWANLAEAWMREGSDLKAVRPLRRALAIDPNMTAALSLMAKIYISRGRREAGEELMRRAGAIGPTDPDLHASLGMCLLTRERYEEGWPEYEQRLRTSHSVEPRTSAPRWRGEANPTGTLMVYTEQGYGDNIQFVRYLAMAKERWRGHVRYYNSHPELLALFQASRLPVEIVAWSRETPYPVEGYDAYVGLMSLPGLYRTTTETIPAGVPYLRAPKDRAEAWRGRIGRGPELNVGLVWAGRTDYNIDRRRASDVSHLAPLAGMDGVRFYSLQMGAEARQLEAAPAGLEIVGLGKDIRDFADTAAIIERLDLLVSIDSAPAHLAGALGRPVWTLLPFSADWRWLIDREDSPWYPTMRLFRQPKYGAWAPVWSRAAEELKLVAEGRSAARS
jgi:Flp pilus assembly protein TadD